jgi:peroxiredoxin
MKKILKQLLILLALFPTLALAAPEKETLFDLEGRPHALAEYTGKGKWLVVTVWASDCAVCNKEVHELMAFHQAHRETDASVLGISVDGPAAKENALAFIKRHGVNFPNLLDDGSAFKAIYLRATGRPWFGGTPMNLVYSPSGELLARRIGPLGKAEIEAFIKQAGEDKR